MLLTDFGDLIADRMRAEHRALAARWFERLLELLPVEARDVFPSERLLDHVPDLILEIAGYLRQPEDAAIAANTAIIEKAREFGALRHGQKASLHQLLREYQLLSAILMAFVMEETERGDVVPSPSQVALLVSRLNDAVAVLSQVTVEAFVTLYTETITQQRERLEQFTRMAAHEWRQPLGALQFGVALLRQGSLEPALTARTLDTLDRNVRRLVELTQKLETIARMRDTPDTAVIQEVSSASVATEAARQLSEMADARGVDIRIADTLPTLTVDVGRLELSLVNLLSNAIKYADPAKPSRWVEIRGGQSDGSTCVITISDNGIGIPAAAQSTIFERFTRAHAARAEAQHVSGIGLGLSIVDDCVRAMAGQIEVQSAEGFGTTFVLTLPVTPAAVTA